MENQWGISSAGRAPALQAGGRRFDPVILHQKVLKEHERRSKPKAFKQLNAFGLYS
jgi:hypothetical protein